MNSIPARREEAIAELAELWGLGTIWRTRSFTGTGQNPNKPRNLTREVSAFRNVARFLTGRVGLLGGHFMPSVVKTIGLSNAVAECRRPCKELQTEGRKTGKR